MDELADKFAREKITNQLDWNFFVEAGAGSGKTYCLVERMVNIIKKGKANMENIAAVTFTRKAAAELKERFQIKLENSLGEDNSMGADEKKNIQIALFNLEQIYIGTIHSFCSKILRERPVEAGVDPGFEEIEEARDYIYSKEAWSDFVNYSSEIGESALKFMEEYGIEINDLDNTYWNFIKYPDVKIETAIIAEPDFSETKREIKQFISFMKDMFPQETPENGWDGLQNIIRRSDTHIKSGYLNSKRLFIKLLNEMNKTPTIVQKNWPLGNGKECKEKMENFQNDIVKPAIKSWQEYMHKPLAEFIKKGAEFYKDWRKSRSILNFEDLLTVTSDLLRENNEVRKYFKKKFTHILVDEFQDTDPIQAEIIFFLTGKDTAETGWKNINPEQGSLFLVGDPKQSIYRFRRADIDIYNIVRDKFTGEGCEVLHLFSNFRSLPFMQDLVKSVFEKILPETENDYQAKYFPLNTTRSTELTYDSGIFENPIEKVYKDNISEITLIDAEKVAAWIESSVNEGRMKLKRTSDEIKSGLTERAQYSDFLILTKTRKSLGLYSKALEKKGIPYDISGGLVFNESLELSEILKLFKAIDDDKDPVALVSALRGLFFGISDETLYKYKKAGGNFSYYTLVPDGFLMFDEAFKRLRDYKEIINNFKPVVAAEAIIEKTGIIALALSEEEGLMRAGNIYKAMELLKDFEDDKTETFFDLTKNMEEILTNQKIESMSLLVSKKNTVRLMNLHKAKGLESPVVILADPMRETKNFEPQYHISRTKGENARGYFPVIKKNPKFGSETIGIPPDWSSKLEEEKKYEEAEKMRLEYVAVTRAKNILAVSTYREGARAKSWEVLYNFLKDAKKMESHLKVNNMEIESVNISKSAWEKEKDRIKDNLSHISSASYSINKVTSEAKEGFVFTGSTDGKGIKWGSISHKAVELACKGYHRKLQILTKKWIDEAGMEKRSADELAALVDRFMKSSLWERIMAASQKFFETAFAYGSNKEIVYGVIDLIFKENNKWVIVDYKTDDFEADKEKKAVYFKQLELYRKYWESITREEVSEIILYKL
ncbi:MAG: UvrD-helicase domain-containing protein [Candidatus Humimicrobiaceae bacterium]